MSNTLAIIQVVAMIATIVGVAITLVSFSNKSASRSATQTEMILRLRIDLDEARHAMRELEGRVRESENDITAISEKLDSIFRVVQEIKEELAHK